MIRRRTPVRRTPARRGVAAVEFAFVAWLFVVPLIIGVWEVGRLIQVQQIVSNSAREGARLASQAVTLYNGVPTQIKTTTSSPSVKSVVYQHLYAAGLTNLTMSDVTVNFYFTSGRTSNYVPVAADPTGTSYPVGSMPPDPCYGEKNQSFVVYVSIPWDKVRWINLGLLRPNNVEYYASWQMLIDERFTLNPTLPTW
jgi:Flp pilus assembly protein TadG